MLVNQVPSLVDDVAIFVLEVAGSQGVVSIYDLATPISLEVTHDIILIKVPLVERLRRLVFDPSLHVLEVYLLSQPLGLWILLENVLVFGKVQVSTDTAELNALRIRRRRQVAVSRRLMLQQLRGAQLRMCEETRSVEDASVVIVWSNTLYQSLHSLLVALL